MLRSPLAAVFSALVTLSLSGCNGVSSSPPPATMEKIKISYPTFSASVAPLLIAVDKGYFAEQRLDPEWVKAGGGAATPMLIAGEVPYTTSSGSAISAIISGAPLKVVYTIEDRPGYELWSVSPDMKSVEDIKGKTIGIQTRGDTNEIAMSILLKNHKLPLNAVSYAAVGSEQNKLAAMQNGSVPLAVIGASTALQYKSAGGKGKMLADLKEEVQMVYTGLATTDKELRENRERTKRFLRATLKGREYFKTFKDETLDILGKYNQLPRPANEVDYDDDIPALTPDGSVPLEVQQADTVVRAQLIGVEPPPVSRIYDYSILAEVNQELKASGWKPQK